mmetsp:Transcript_12669/g.12703  ORF Transcript_12669/g.12703 Transcript_12669/m.12703 type:complete len:84 (-) Transcript_12669:241-492(-)
MIQKAEQDRLRKEGLEQAQIEEVSRLEKLQKEQEDLTGFQNDNSHEESQKPQFIMTSTFCSAHLQNSKSLFWQPQSSSYPHNL